MSEPKEPRVITIGEARHDPVLFAALIELMAQGEHRAIEVLGLEPPLPVLRDDFAESLRSMQASIADAIRLRSAYDRGTGGRSRPKESTTAMMLRLGRAKPAWSEPTMKEFTIP